MDDLRGKVINELVERIESALSVDSDYVDNVRTDLLQTVVGLLKAQELPDVKPEKLEERTTKWLDQMTAEERLEEIAAILDDWDGYRTAKGLAGLINEVWAYALYPVKTQEARLMTLEEVKDSIGKDMFLEIATYPGKPSYLTAATLDGVGTRGLTLYHSSFEFECYNRKTYGWRCWNARPTDEQREKVKWE